MKALTIWQPWASLIIIGAKPYEFRRASYLERNRYRGSPDPGERIVIHAGARKIYRPEVENLLEHLGMPTDRTGLIAARARPLLELVLASQTPVIPLGCGLGTVVLGEPQIASELFRVGIADSDRGTFNWAWPMTKIEQWHEPVTVAGRPGFWQWPFSAA